MAGQTDDSVLDILRFHIAADLLAGAVWQCQCQGWRGQQKTGVRQFPHKVCKRNLVPVILHIIAVSIGYQYDIGICTVVIDHTGSQIIHIHQNT